jgi:hypothetical protein
MAQFIKLGVHTINVDTITYISKRHENPNLTEDKTHVYFIGGDKPLQLDDGDEKVFEDYLASMTLDLRSDPDKDYRVI